MFRLIAVPLLLSLTACPAPTLPTPDASCEEPLFGQPVTQTGLDSTQCRPSCSHCGDAGFTSRDFTSERLAELKAWPLTTPFDELTSDPYTVDGGFPFTPGQACGVVIDDASTHRYHLQTFDSPEAVTAAGAWLTHHDACGLCSTLVDFAVYAGDRDIGKAVQKCGVDNFGRPVSDVTACLERLGFTRPCAQIWAFNTRHTQVKCLDVCLTQLDAPYHSRDGKLNSCLACDELKSGAVFKAIAGRTRRNTGLASSMCRPCSEVQPVAHDYP